MAASLDHALWFHRPFRADEWLLYAQDSPNLSGARGFSRGLIFGRDGLLVASVAQEGLVARAPRRQDVGTAALDIGANPIFGHAARGQCRDARRAATDGAMHKAGAREARP